MVEEKVRIIGIAPYENLKSALEHIGNFYENIDLTVYTGDLYDALAIIQQLPPNSYDCIISRGGTAELLRTATDFPVIDIHISVYDVLRTIKLADNYSEKYAIVGFPGITEPALTLCDLLGRDIKIVMINSTKEVADVLDELKEEGYNTVICDVITHKTAQNMNLNAFLIDSGAESLHAAIDQAITMNKTFRPLRYENLFLKSISQQENVQVIVLDSTGNVFYESHENVSESFIASLRNSMTTIAKGHTRKFYLTQAREFYRITAQTMEINNKLYYIFFAMYSPISLRSQFTGIRIMDQSECEYLVQNSFYSISGALGTLDTEIKMLASTPQPIMIRGESGTGKEQISRFLYLHGPSANRPFVTINCKLMTEKSWEYLLNHHNSPLNDTKNTVYFQGLEHLSETQLLRLASIFQETGLQNRIRLIFSFVCLDNEPVPEPLRNFSMKLGCVILNLPSLRSRSDEIPFLAGLYLSKLNFEQGKIISGFEHNAVDMLRHYHWPNNYTQFKHVLETLSSLTNSYIRRDLVAKILNDERTIYEEEKQETDALFHTNMPLDEIIHHVVKQAVATNGGNRTAAAKQLGISRTTLWRYLTQD